jgi:hypothetical protein
MTLNVDFDDFGLLVGGRKIVKVDFVDRWAR